MTLIEHNAEDSSDEDEEVRGSGGAINCIRYAVRGHILYLSLAPLWITETYGFQSGLGPPEGTEPSLKKKKCPPPLQDKLKALDNSWVSQ